MQRCLLASVVLFQVLLWATVESKLLDLARDKDMVVKFHNDERGNVRPQAANMREMTWDMKLQSQAEQWASQCEYARPPRNWNVGSNLYYTRDFVHGHGSTRQFVRRSMDAWVRSKANFAYSSNCGSACLYVQMIHSEVDSIGCAASTCKNLRTRGHGSQRATLFVCVYSPMVDLRSTFPYLEGRPCTLCPSGQFCIDGNRCSKGIASRLPDPYPNVQPLERQPITGYLPRQIVADSMTSEERRTILNLHNDFRRDNNRQPLLWDNYLERWTKHVVNCSVDYPGPIYTYSNFHRFDSSSVLSSALYEWQTRAEIKPPRVEHKCRTPDDQGPCSHWSNMMQDRISSMACSTKACPGYTRQMVCIYDNRADRDNRIAELRRIRQPSRRWRNDNNRFSERYQEARDYRRREDYRRRRHGRF